MTTSPEKLIVTFRYRHDKTGKTTESILRFSEYAGELLLDYIALGSQLIPPTPPTNINESAWVGDGKANSEEKTLNIPLLAAEGAFDVLSEVRRRISGETTEEADSLRKQIAKNIGQAVECHGDDMLGLMHERMMNRLMSEDTI